MRVMHARLLAPSLLFARSCTRAGNAPGRWLAPSRHDTTTTTSTPSSDLAPSRNTSHTMVCCPDTVALAREALCNNVPPGSYLAVDCEGVDLPTTLTLVQVALVGDLEQSTAPRVFLFDTMDGPHHAAVVACLRDVFMAPASKILHSSRSDLLALKRHAGVVMAPPIIDTQVAAGLLGTGAQCSLHSLQVRYGLPAKTKVHWTFHRGWGHRPLSPAHVAYACGDVLDLPHIWLQQRREASAKNLEPQFTRNVHRATSDGGAFVASTAAEKCANDTSLAPRSAPLRKAPQKPPTTSAAADLQGRPVAKPRAPLSAKEIRTAVKLVAKQKFRVI